MQIPDGHGLLGHSWKTILARLDLFGFVIDWTEHRSNHTLLVHPRTLAQTANRIIVMVLRVCKETSMWIGQASMS
jgi:hypothetical protein